MISDERIFAAKILAIDDNILNIQILKKILTNAGFINITATTDSTQALALYKEIQPDLILLDLNLPDVQGYEVLMLLQAEIKTSAIPIVVISADAMPQQLAKLLKAGARNYLTKPLDVPAFLLEVDKWLG